MHFLNSDISLNIENRNYFLPNLWINAIFLQCCAFILWHVVCQYCKASLFLLFYWSFPHCASVVLTKSTEWCSVLIHDFFCNIRYLITLVCFFLLSQRLLLQICLIWLLSYTLSPPSDSPAFPSLPCFGDCISSYHIFEDKPKMLGLSLQLFISLLQPSLYFFLLTSHSFAICHKKNFLLHHILLLSPQMIAPFFPMPAFFYYF